VTEPAVHFGKVQAHSYVLANAQFVVHFPDSEQNLPTFPGNTRLQLVKAERKLASATMHPPAGKALFTGDYAEWTACAIDRDSRAATSFVPNSEQNRAECDTPH